MPLRLVSQQRVTLGDYFQTIRGDGRLRGHQRLLGRRLKHAGRFRIVERNLLLFEDGKARHAVETMRPRYPRRGVPTSISIGKSRASQSVATYFRSSRITCRASFFGNLPRGSRTPILTRYCSRAGLCGSRTSGASTMPMTLPLMDLKRTVATVGNDMLLFSKYNRSPHNGSGD